MKLKSEGVIMFNWGLSDQMVGGKVDLYKNKFKGNSYIGGISLTNLLKI